MADLCTNIVRGKTLRTTQLDACGTPVTDVDGPIRNVTEGFISVAYANEIDQGTEIAPKNANDQFCFIVPGCPTIKWVNLTVTYCGVDPYLISLMTGWPVVLDASGAATGFRGRRKVRCDRGFALELWTGSAPAVGPLCDPANPLPRYGYFLLPFVTAAYMGDLTVENGAANFTLIAKGLAGGNWGVGPYDVVRGVSTTSPLATPIGSDDLYDFEVVTLPPLPGVCGKYPPLFDFTVTNTSGHTENLQNTVVPSAHANTIDWGDGTTSAGTTITGPPGTSHTYTAAGTYLVSVTDNVTGSRKQKLVVVP